MNVVVCVKLTPDANDIEVRPDGSISLARAEWIIGGFDLQAIEAGVQLVEAQGGKVTALSAGPLPISNSKLKKDILSRGPDELVMVVDDALQDADTYTTAQVLAQAIRELGQVDLVLCGEGSADLYFQQVGLQVGEMFGLPTLNFISKIDVEGDHLVVERNLEEEIEVLEVPLPAVLSVTTDITQARLPKMTEILKASKKPVTERAVADLGLPEEVRPRVEKISTRAPHRWQRKQVMIPGSPDEAVQLLAGYLNKEGIL
ncbi:MAG: putative electron transfer flavoprotein FixA [Chloroflexi bacterium]|nr:MAG: putative electron transfer flavoprotein FixA [Chloroflexota bacterium]